ncbi:MAG: TonB-dependent receptor, partial [Novosphingobium sp.]|nr:TonB-dependent receptor [Novosphingobium sp.]
PTPGGGTPVNRTLNAGAARVYGAELEFNYAPRSIEGLSFQFSAAYTHARLLAFGDAPCYGGQTFAMGCNQLFTPSANQAVPGAGAITVDGVSGFYRAQDLGGTPMVRAPKWQVNFGFAYDMPLENGWTLSFTNTSQYSSRYLTTPGRRADFYAPSYFKTDFGLAVKGAEDRWEVAFIGKNLTNRITASSCTSSNVANGTNFGGQITGGGIGGPAGIDEVGCYADRGRELWLRLTLRPFN